jgi:hypothetical protein
LWLRLGVLDCFGGELCGGVGSCETGSVQVFCLA